MPMPNIVSHLFVRVPWHDSKWNGSICNAPIENSSCIAVPDIHRDRDDVSEAMSAGRLIPDLKKSQYPPCLRDNGMFMAPFSMNLAVTHPARYHPAFDHICTAFLAKPRYSIIARPYGWMLRNRAEEVSKFHGLEYDAEKEKAYGLDKYKWVVDLENQRNLLEGFFDVLAPKKSLVFLYAPLTPLSDEPSPVIVAVGRVQAVAEIAEYPMTQSSGIPSYVWDRAIMHSIRPDGASEFDGFILPYHTLLKLAAKNPKIDLSSCIARAPKNKRREFAYVSEHVGGDGAITALLACSQALQSMSEVGIQVPAEYHAWLNERLADAWQWRGAYPGLSAALNAFKLPYSSFIARHLVQETPDGEDVWNTVRRMFSSPSEVLPPSLAEQVSPTLSKVWTLLKEKKPERIDLLRLLSRMDLSFQQASRLFETTERDQAEFAVKDGKLLQNPYLVFELTRRDKDPVTVETVDRAVCPPEAVRLSCPVPEPSAVKYPLDLRRIGALALATTSEAADAGHTYSEIAHLLLDWDEHRVMPECAINGDLLEVCLMEPPRSLEVLEAGNVGLKSIIQAETLIANAIYGWLLMSRHSRTPDWQSLLINRLGTPESAIKAKALEEKIIALNELSESRFSILTGGAGTGKTLTLATLAQQLRSAGESMLLLAPTGKARVRLQAGCGEKAYTVAQWLLPLERFDPDNGRYSVRPGAPKFGAQNVIIDEASMLTVEMLAAVFDALAGVHRVILAGDPDQLPPIGAGKPFVDIIEFLSMKVPGSSGAPGIARLETGMRQLGDRTDMALPQLFRNMSTVDTMRDATAVLHGGETSHLKFVQWATPADLYDRLAEVLTTELQLVGPADETGFEKSLGGQPNENGYMRFKSGKVQEAESWQILSPVRGLPYGINNLNRQIQKQFLSETIRVSRYPQANRFFPRPSGKEDIVYGDKVMNTRNRRIDSIYPKDVDGLRYIANGEIGIITGRIAPGSDRVEVSFSSQPGYSYSFWNDDVEDLELAYATTVHKAQGSDFDLTILILPERAANLSRELLYTALTRHKNRLVVLHQGERGAIIKYASEQASDIRRRRTNLKAFLVGPSHK